MFRRYALPSLSAFLVSGVPSPIRRGLVATTLVLVFCAFASPYSAEAQANCVTSFSLTESSPVDWESGSNWDDDRNDNGIPDGNESTGVSAVVNDSGPPCDEASSGYPSASDENATITNLVVEISDGSDLSVGNIVLDNDGEIRPNDPGRGGSSFTRPLQIKSLTIQQSSSDDDNFNSQFVGTNGSGSLTLSVSENTIVSGTSTSIGKIVASSQTVDLNNDLTIKGNGELASTGSIEVAGDLTNSGTFSGSGSTVTFDGGTTQSLDPGDDALGGVTITSGTTVDATGHSGAVEVQGDFENRGTFDGNGIIFNGSGNQEVSGAALTFSSFEVDGGNVTVDGLDSDAGQSTVTGEVRVADGTLALQDNSTTLSVQGNLIFESDGGF